MIKEENKIFSSKSMVDDFGRVFTYKGRIFRKINNHKKEKCLSIINSPLIAELEEKRLIPKTTISNEFNESEGLILEHERLIESLQHEWSFNMLKDAALVVLEINQIANKHGYELKDAHTLNILFNSTKPMFVDIGSFEKRSSSSEWQAYQEFLTSLVIPLIFWSKNKHYIVRKMLESNFHRMFTAPNQSIEDSGLLNLIGSNNIPFNFSLKNKILFKTTKEIAFWKTIMKIPNFILRKIMGREINLIKYEQKSEELTTIYPIAKIKEFITSLPNPTLGSNWHGYHQKYYNENGTINYSNRFKRILEIIKNLGTINSVIDLAGNEGYFSLLLNQELDIKRIILTDYDENAIDTAYKNLKKSKINNITPLLLNFMFTPDLEGTTKRLKSDVAIALAVTHHLVLTGNFSINAIFERLKMYSNKFVIVEFMPLGLWAVGDKNLPEVPEWYTLDWFRSEFENYFDKIIEEQLEENRIVFVGKI
ncbi:MAG: hypothetical protein H6587_02120 [Flavobacteriales bacterium]|nr:hypothetical protein [Flavobacteriales bacterium]MCB9363341.1 hypothetical protein [Flavobacteriales bacterium]